MIHGQNAKKTLPIFQSSTTNAGTASGNVDTLGYDYLELDVYLPTSDAATNNPSVLKLSESDDTVVTNFANISGAVGDTDFTIPNCATAASNIDGPFTTFNVDLRARKRYIKVSVSPLTTQVVNVVARLSRGEKAPVSTTDTNSDAIVTI